MYTEKRHLQCYSSDIATVVDRAIFTHNWTKYLTSFGESCEREMASNAAAGALMFTDSDSSKVKVIRRRRHRFHYLPTCELKGRL